MTPTGRSALLIGGTGPTGPHIASGLRDRGYAVTLLNRGTRTVAGQEDLEVLVADPHFEESLARALAGRTFDLVIASYGRLRLMPGVVGTCTQRFITIGGTAYADTAGAAADEDTPRDLTHKIVRRMVETEQVLQEAHDAGTFSHTHLRYPLLWGPGQLAPREWSIVRRVLDGRGVIPVVDGARTLESRCFVTNAAAGVLAAVDHPEASAGRTYNVADDYTPDDERRVKDLCTALGKPDMRLANFPQQVTGPAGFWGVGRDLTATPMIPASTRHRVVSTARIRSELGHRDVITYEDAVRVTAHHYRSEPLELGGAQELKLGDPFDYAAEDALLRELVAFEDRAAEVGFSGGGFVHQYDHPPAPGT